MKPWQRPAAALVSAGLTLLGLLGLGLWLNPSASAGLTQATQSPWAFLPVLVLAATSTPTPTATPTATPLPVTPPTSGDWHAVLNYYRASAHLPALTENAAWSDGTAKHARYMVINDVLVSSEGTATPEYSPEGAEAAPNSNLLLSDNFSLSDQQALDFWMDKPFHALGLLNPGLLSTGFGSYREDDGVFDPFKMGAAIDVRRGLGAIPSAVQFPIKWPDHNATVYLTSYDGNEQPDPLSSCSGFNPPSGLPIILLLGPGNLTPSVTADSFRQGNTPLAHCVFDETDYGNSIGALQNLGRALLHTDNAVVLIPQQPLTPGASYTASITANGQTTTWTFSVAP